MLKLINFKILPKHSIDGINDLQPRPLLRSCWPWRVAGGKRIILY